MNDKTHAILLQMVVQLNSSRWVTGPDWEITLKGEGHIPLIKKIGVQGNMGEEEWRDEVDTYIDLKLATDDEITYIPELSLYATIEIEGGSKKDIAYKMEIAEAFTDKDVRDKKKISMAAKKIDRQVDDYIEMAYSDYVDMNAEDLKAYRQGGWKQEEPPIPEGA